MLLVLFLVLRLWLKRTRTRRLARTILKRTEGDLRSGKLDGRAAAFQIGRAVRFTHPLPDDWATFKQDLDFARFSPTPIDTQQAIHLLAQARRWIAHAA